MKLRKLPLLLAAAAIAAAATIRAAEPVAEPDVLDMSIDENLATPEVPRKAKAYVHAAMDQLRRHLIKNGMTVEALRDGEVLEITVPASRLFAATAVEPKASATEALRPLGMVARDPDKYKIIVAVHTDDTGDDKYADSISGARANAVDDCLWILAGEKDTNVVPYGIGKDEPRVPNTSMANRAQNRRVEIFVVPERGMLEQAGVKRK